MMHPGVLVLDFGSQYTQLIARRVRELGVYSEIKPCTLGSDEISEAVRKNIRAVILSGSPWSTNSPEAPKFDKRWLELGLPTLGICYGQQLIAKLCGATVKSGVSREYGYATLEVEKQIALFDGFDRREKTTVWMSHGDHVDELPNGFEVLAVSAGAPFAAIGDAKRKIYALQFHPEVSHTARGKEILGNFLFKVALLEPSWSPADLIDQLVRDIAQAVGPSGVAVCGISGGVDSSVAALIVKKALGPRLHCIFVDNGLLRKNEAVQVAQSLGGEGLGLNLQVVDAADRFLSALSGVADPERKRKIIGQVFIDVFEEEAKKIAGATHLVQGTLYPDVIESVSVRGPSVVIKSHHNVGGLPEKMHLKLIEPLRELFKDEVRVLGRSLGLPDNLLKRQPFPGPGLAVRVLGELSAARLSVEREADAIFQEEIRAAGLYEQLWQSFAVLLPVKSVGVMGDERTYEETAVLRAVYSEDGMTADWAYLPQDLLRRVSSRIINEVKGINRVVLDISSKPPATIEWE